MTKPAVLKLLFNAGGILVGLILVGYLLFAGYLPQTKTSCRERYPSTTRLSLHSSQGKPFSPIELQARAGLMEWGVLDNASVVPHGADGTALQIKLATLTEVEGSTERATNGVYFNWPLAAMGNATVACLSYSVWLPKDFAFDSGGVLPGILGGVPGENGGMNRFATRARWLGDGRISLDDALPGAGFRPASRASAALAPGQWTLVEQEIVLNTPDKSDGLVRMWIDGQQAEEKKGIALRKDASARFLGVRADIGYLRDPAKPGELRLTPFELSWR